MDFLSNWLNIVILFFPNTKRFNRATNNGDIANEREEKFNLFAKFPYYGKQSTSIKNELFKIVNEVSKIYKCRSIFVNNHKIKSLFPVKERLEDLMCSNIVYKYNCHSCGSSYVGLSTRNLNTRMAEHMGVSPRTGTKLGVPLFSAIREHCVSGCNIEKSNFKILMKSEKPWDLPTLEAIYIKSEAPDLNKSSGITLNIF